MEGELLCCKRQRKSEPGAHGYCQELCAKMFADSGAYIGAVAALARSFSDTVSGK